MTTVEDRVVRALRSGPLYRPALELVVGAPEKVVGAALRRLLAEGRVEIAREVGPATDRLREEP